MLILNAVVIAAVLAPVPAAPPAGLDPAAVDRFVAAYRSAAGLPGVSVAVTRGNEVVHTGGYGHDSAGRPVTARTPMRIASLSKSFTARAVLRLVEDGRVALDRPVRDVLPEFRMADPRAAAITVRQVLSHSSGITQAAFPTADLPPAPSLREAVGQLATARLGAAPGTVWSYHNANYWIAARLVEAAAGRAFPTYLRDEIFTPLGMSRTVATVTTGEPVPGLADGHTLVYGVPVARPEIREFDAGSGGIVSTAGDLAAWLIGQRDPALAELHRPAAPGGGYGLGWFVGEKDGVRRVWHGGTAWAFSSYQVLLPDSGYGIMVLSNSRPAYVEDTAGLVDGLVALTRGRAPGGGMNYRLIAEAVVVTLTLASVAGSLTVCRRAHRWAERRRRWTVPLRLFPYVVTAGGVAAFPRLMTAVGWDVNWHQLAVVAPSFVVLLAVTATGAVTGVAVRLLRLAQLRSVRTGGARRSPRRTRAAGSSGPPARPAGT